MVHMELRYFYAVLKKITVIETPCDVTKFLHRIIISFNFPFVVVLGRLFFSLVVLQENTFMFLWFEYLENSEVQ